MASSRGEIVRNKFSFLNHPLRVSRRIHTLLICRTWLQEDRTQSSTLGFGFKRRFLHLDDSDQRFAERVHWTRTIYHRESSLGNIPTSSVGTISEYSLKRLH